MPSKRSLEQNSKFHAICSDISKSGMHFAGRPRSPLEWKLLLISGHSAATKGDVELVSGLEGEMLILREQTSQMSIARLASLIEYSEAFWSQYKCQN